ncbi:hypothetical protein BFP72_04805 [Reichenbachiella sp. 5M10]|uniref:RDD family protein n=1 Tax=Reichenbachiella sp. 5M10 TaxID=1889772 RepID=UPI000C15F49E|nr:RDD family protein [Reichenbachiella sp. 5M10]PIB34770.1 hypothetical protein BFP72_04805 [Reichenbachiella sp. 5M10]
MNIYEGAASFSKRLFAYNIDITVMMLLMLPFLLWVESDRLFYGAAVAIVCLYHALMESSSWQGTLGKHYSHMVVTDSAGQPIGFGRALLRILCKFLSLGLLFGGFMMIYFREDRRGLHDLLAGTVVRPRGIPDA